MKKGIFIFFTLICLSVITIVPACKCSITEPWHYDFVIWYSNEPKIEIIIFPPDTYWEGTLIVNNEQIPISLSWGPTESFDILDNSKESQDKPVEEARLMWGWVDYDENTATLIIEEDYIFDYKYDKIVLYRKDLPKDE